MKLSPNYVKQKFHIDWTLTIIMAALFTVSMVSIYLAMPLVSNVRGLIEKQVLWYITGFMIVGFLIYLGTNNLYQITPILYWILMGALVLLFLDRFINVPFVSEINGARAWFLFPGIGSFQPSEFMKIVLILMSADIVSEHNKAKVEDSYAEDISLFLKIFKIAIPPLVLIVLQPDTGIPLVIVISIMVMVFVSGIQRSWIYISMGTFIAVFAIFLYIYFNHQQFLLNLFDSDSLRLSRFFGWLEPEKYMRSWGNQLYEGLLALGSGGIDGHPLRQVLVLFAEPQNDFIFAVIGQNFGFIGTSFVVILSCLFDLKVLSIAFNSTDQRNKLMAIGMLGMIVFQQVENMGMITGLLPITGITLPFISYGGSSLWSYMIPLSIIFKMASDNIQKNGTFFV